MLSFETGWISFVSFCCIIGNSAVTSLSFDDNALSASFLYYGLFLNTIGSLEQACDRKHHLTTNLSLDEIQLCLRE